MKGHDNKGYLLEGVDMVPNPPLPRWEPLYNKEVKFHAGKIKYSVARLVELLQEANNQADQVDTLDWNYNNLHADYLALKGSRVHTIW